MDMTKDGGAAFPHVSHDASGGAPWVPEPGMSLRDWFAGMAPPVRQNDVKTAWAKALLGEDPPDWHLDDGKSYVDYCFRAEAAYRYAYADALLAARGRHE